MHNIVCYRAVLWVVTQHSSHLALRDDSEDKKLPRPYASLFRAAKAFRVTWPKRRCEAVSRPFASDTSTKWIDREGLGKRCTGTRQDKKHVSYFLLSLIKIAVCLCKTQAAPWVSNPGGGGPPFRAIFVWPWKTVSVSVHYLFYQPMQEKIKTWTLRFPAKENPNMKKALFDQPIVLQYDVTVKYRLISRKF